MSQVEEFEPCGEQDDRTARLLAKIEIAGVPHHMEAIAVVWRNESGEVIDPNKEEEFPSEWLQTAADGAWQEMLDEYYNAAGGDGNWYTTMIDGREYVLCITPYCQ